MDYYKWFLLFAIGLASVPSVEASENWPRFRGPNGNGVALHSEMPVFFGPQSNVVWKTSMLEGNSSPCIWENHLFLTGVREKRLVTLCLDRSSGKTIWEATAPEVPLEKVSSLGSQASSTPGTDGTRLYVYFGSFGLLCYDFEGHELWQHRLPIPITQHGTGTSPIISGKNVFLTCDQDTGSFLLALNIETGKEVWRADRSDFRRGFATPVLWKINQKEVLVLAGTLRAVAYDISNGKEVCSIFGLPNEMCASPIAADGTLYIASWTAGVGQTKMGPFDALLEKSDKNHDGKIGREEVTSGPASMHFDYIDANKDGQITRQEWDSIATIF